MLEIAVFARDHVGTRPIHEGETLTIGRSAECDIHVPDPSVSRKHAALHFGSSLSIEDLGGANGTFVHSGRADASAGQTRSLRHLLKTSAPLGVGDSVTLGTALLVVRKADPAPAPVSSKNGMLVRSARMREVEREATLAARGMLPVLILGETGVGKEALARFIHASSRRVEGPFLGLNCGAFTESLLESELFGHEKGSFTGAAGTKPGLLESAAGGTVLLDEVGELPMVTQVKLLRVLEERHVLRVGGRAPRPIDVRFVAATNRDLERMSAEGTFREDLYYRIGAMILRIPPLRERTEEIVPLAERFLVAASEQLGLAQPPRLSDETVALLCRYSWPGNVRELRNVIDRAVVLCTTDVIDPSCLPAAVLGAREAALAREEPKDPGPRSPRASDPMEALKQEMVAADRARIVAALNETGGNQTRAAELLGISRRTLVTKLGQYGIPRPRK